MTAPDHRPWLTTWGEVITSLRTLAFEDEVWFGGGPNSPDDPCAVVDGTEIIDDVPPDEVLQQGWRDELGKSDLQQILSNLIDQVDEPGMDLILRAIRYYADHDAFLSLE